MIDLPYILIRERIKTEVSALNEVMYYLGQPDTNEDGELLFTTPAVFIRFDQVVTKSLNLVMGLPNKQQAEVLFTVTLVDETAYDDDRRILDTTMNHIGKVNAIFLALQGYVGKLSDIPGNSALANTVDDWIVCNPMDRRRITTDHSVRGTIATAQQFVCIVNDLCTLPQYIDVMLNLQAQLGLTINYV
jgi:hypothetical protein